MPNPTAAMETSLDAAALQERRRRWSSGALVVSVSIAYLIAIATEEWVKTTTGAMVVGITGLTLVAVLLVATVLAYFFDDEKGNTLSEMARESTRDTPFYPWALGIYTGRWFHPLQELQPSLGGYAAYALPFLTLLLVGVGEWQRKRGRRLPPWLTLLAGYVAGVLCWPS